MPPPAADALREANDVPGQPDDRARIGQKPHAVRRVRVTREDKACVSNQDNDGLQPSARVERAIE
jgi:hypothetical protein